MYNSIWLKERATHLHRFLWRDGSDERTSEYAITRVNIGDRPPGGIAQLAMRLTARLPIFSHLEDGRRVLEDSYVDDLLTSHNDRKLDKVTEGIEKNPKSLRIFSQTMGPIRGKWEEGNGSRSPEEGVETKSDLNSSEGE